MWGSFPRGDPHASPERVDASGRGRPSFPRRCLRRHPPPAAVPPAAPPIRSLATPAPDAAGSLGTRGGHVMLCRPSSCHPLLPTPREAVGPWLPIRSSPGLWVVSRGWSWSISGAAPRKLHHSSTPQTPARLTLVWSGGVENVLVQTHVAHTCVHTQTQTHTCTPCTDMRMRGHRHLCAGRGWWPCRVRRGLRAALRCRPCALPSSPSRGSFPMRFWGEGSLQLPLAFPPATSA